MIPCFFFFFPFKKITNKSNFQFLFNRIYVYTYDRAKFVSSSNISSFLFPHTLLSLLYLEIFVHIKRPHFSAVCPLLVPSLFIYLVSAFLARIISSLSRSRARLGNFFENVPSCLPIRPRTAHASIITFSSAKYFMFCN